jgi:hypothetical protein
MDGVAFQQRFILAKMVSCCGAGPAGKLPFGLGRQSVPASFEVWYPFPILPVAVFGLFLLPRPLVARRQFFLAAEPVAEQDGFDPSHILYRMLLCRAVVEVRPSPLGRLLGAGVLRIVDELLKLRPRQFTVG